MSFYVYILSSNKNGKKKTYVGWTNNLKKSSSFYDEILKSIDISLLTEGS